jgi:hypothetical protein
MVEQMLITDQSMRVYETNLTFVASHMSYQDYYNYKVTLIIMVFSHYMVAHI